ncbi:MAG TPA: 23S ribosomal RNA methyltransferase Erm [Chloroflexota bacterium]|nr:23S ribosomal RNA methyltransferase Erm [Chloroflexota bacterium]
MQRERPQNIVSSQNFLHDAGLVARLLDQSTISPDDLVLEIGPGKGIITAQLAERCRMVVAVEKDRELARRLGQRFADFPNVAIHAADFLDFPLPRCRYKVFANIPFIGTNAILAKLTARPTAPDDTYLALQKEAAASLLGQPAESLSTVLLKSWLDVSVVHGFRRTDFVPAPGVDVVMIRLRQRGPPLIDRTDDQLFRDFVVYGFTAWRVSLRATFDRLFGHQRFSRLVQEIGVDPAATPTNVQFDQWLRLFEGYKATLHAQAGGRVAGSEARLRQLQERRWKIRQLSGAERPPCRPPLGLCKNQPTRCLNT